MDTSNLSRRNILRGGALAASSLLILPSWAAGKGASPNSKVNLALIGVGGRGNAPVNALRHENYVAFCDVDDERAAKTYKTYPKVPRFKDYRVMFDKMGKEIDGVVITTPDHMHYPIALWALANGKHVYCEKPLTRCIWEARELKRIAKEAGVITQMGNQGHTYNGVRDFQEWHKAGLFGEIKRVYQWTNRPVWPQGVLERKNNKKVPSTLDYKLWLGVAPKKAYDEDILPFNWRGWLDYGAGAVGDMGCHIMDAAYTGLGLSYPEWVETKFASEYTDETFPKQTRIDYHYAAKDSKPAVHVTWQDGKLLPDEEIPNLPDDFYKKMKASNGTLFVGTKGTAYTDTYARSVRIFPRETYVQVRKNAPPQTLRRIKGGPHIEFANAIREGREASSNFDYGAPFTEVALLGLASIRAKKRLYYDPVNMAFKNAPECNQLLRSNYEYNKEFLPG
ncbi:MAG: Gfo/Idh/MocA family oxidoreductase [Planctomycetes bacterium]|nr:Gfo/Idh/MocA family oxidoreductase [Planctomycetota bacterium]